MFIKSSNHSLSRFSFTQRGFTLLEILLVLGGIAVLGTGALVTYKVVQSRQSTTTAVEGSRYMARSLMQTYGQAGSFEGLNNKSLIDGKLTPKNMATQGATLKNSWGGTVQVNPVGDSSNAFALTWNKVPSGACANMATQLASDFSKIEINGTSVKNDKTSADPKKIANLCDSGNNTLALTSSTVATPDFGEIKDPTDNGGVKLPVSAPLVVGTVNPLVMNPVVISSNAQLAPPTPVAPSVMNVTAAGMSVPPTVYTGNGTPPGATQYDACSSRLSRAPWSPNPQTQAQQINGSAICPSGYVGSDTWKQNQTRSRTASCAVAAAQSDPVWSGWSGWVNTGGKIGEVNTCTASCSTQLASAAWKPNPDVQTRTLSNQSAPCPAGYSGSDTWSQNQTRSRTASCANGASAAAPVWGAYSAWVNSGGKIGEVNTCKPSTGTWTLTKREYVYDSGYDTGDPSSGSDFSRCMDGSQTQNGRLSACPTDASTGFSASANKGYNSAVNNRSGQCPPSLAHPGDLCSGSGWGTSDGKTGQGTLPVGSCTIGVWGVNVRISDRTISGQSGQQQDNGIQTQELYEQYKCQ